MLLRAAAELRLSQPRIAHSLAGLRRRRRHWNGRDRSGRRRRRRLHHSGRTLIARGRRRLPTSRRSAIQLWSTDARPKRVHFRPVLTIAGPRVVATMAVTLAAAWRQAIAGRTAAGLRIQRPTGRLSDAQASVALCAARLMPRRRAGQAKNHRCQDPSYRSHGKCSYCRRIAAPT